MPYRDADKQREYQRRWKAERRARWFADKTCEWCQGSDQLELHHREPGEKVSHKLWSWSEQRRAAELEKCVVLCRPCHEGVHWPQGRPRVRLMTAAEREENEAELAEWIDRTERLYAESVATGSSQ